MFKISNKSCKTRMRLLKFCSRIQKCSCIDKCYLQSFYFSKFLAFFWLITCKKIHFNCFFNPVWLMFVLWIYDISLVVSFSGFVFEAVHMFIVSDSELFTGWSNVYHIFVVVTDSSFIYNTFGETHTIYWRIIAIEFMFLFIFLGFLIVLRFFI